MKGVMEICNQLKNLKTNDSIMLLRQNKNNEKLKCILNFVYNPYITSGMSTAKINKKVSLKPEIKFKTFIDLLNYIQENNTGSDKVIAMTQNYINRLSDAGKIFAIDVITKKLRLGVNAKTINKAFGYEFIPEFQVQLANKYYDVKDKLIQSNKAFAITLKIDGFRCLATKHNGKVTLYARSGKIIEGCNEIESVLLKIPFDDFVIDGEIVARTIGNSSADRYKETSKILLSDGTKKDLCYIMFDYLSYDEFFNKYSNSKYDMRMACLNKIFNVIKENDKQHIFCKITTFYKGKDVNKIDEIMKKIKEQKLEGLMLNIVDAKYEFKRTNNLLKVKTMNDCDLKIVGYKEGVGEFVGMLGAFICEYKGNKIQVGSGYTIEQRKKAWKNPDKFLGKIIKVQYFEETKNQNGNYSLRFPVFLELRKDKKEPNY